METITRIQPDDIHDQTIEAAGYPAGGVIKEYDTAFPDSGCPRPSGDQYSK
jgi:hypothetical protein